MPTTISALDAVTAVHEAASLHPDGLTDASLQAITRLPADRLGLAVEHAVHDGRMEYAGNGRWAAVTFPARN